MPPIKRLSLRDHIGLIEVLETGGKVSLHFGNSTEQSSWHPAQPDQLAFSYYQAMMLPLVLHAAPRRLELFGLGGGAMARFLLSYSDLQVRTHDYRPALRDIAAAHFGLDTAHPRLAMDFADISSADWQMPPAASETGSSADIVLMDLFDDQGMAPVPERSLEQIYARQDDEGIFCVNVWRSAMKDVAYLHHQLTAGPYHRHPLVLHIPERFNTVLCYRRRQWTRQDLATSQKRLRQLHPAARRAVATAWSWMDPLPPGV